ncbi:tetratricopeptide repeat protein [Clostridium isatidis]|uniref:Bacterial Ig-like domain-containing protein n=1 Tax=Clostridium isatidis TaxID=182773 RepID=A0A343JDC2_9CLOT|nr:tetratricopeptide repeat protein [Clostridium isatidis]ASW43530.1 hypothetical protein BEN51_08560 [Clostridium isatidis]
MNKKLIKQINMLALLTLAISLFACTDINKKITISNNTNKEILLEEDEISELINKGKKLLNDERYDEANAYFNKALELDKSNKNLYLKIKDIYLEANRLDDAYFLIKSAISNNVDVENMTKIAEEISSKFEIIKINDSIYQDLEYYFPNTVTTVINNKSIDLPIIWDYQKADTTNIGSFDYYGFNAEYGRKIQLTLTVKEVIYDKQIGSIQNIYTINGKSYIDVDLVEFYWGTETASKEALKDNKILLYDEDGTPYYPNGYYIRNNDSELITYEISDSCSFQLLPNDFLFLGYELPPSSSYTIPNTASFNDFKNYINLYTPYNNEKTNRRTLCWIELKNGVAYSVYRQFTP